MTDLVDILIEDTRWNALDLPVLADSAFVTTLRHLGLEPQRYEISLLACNDDRIAKLNGDFRAKPVPTNVLSWPSEERGADLPGAMPVLPAAAEGQPKTELGDIAISYETCVRESQEAGLSESDHVSHLLVHALLHLLGFDHMRDKDATLMEQVEVETLAKLGISAPYGQEQV